MGILQEEPNQKFNQEEKEKQDLKKRDLTLTDSGKGRENYVLNSDKKGKNILGTPKTGCAQLSVALKC